MAGANLVLFTSSLALNMKTYEPKRHKDTLSAASSFRLIDSPPHLPPTTGKGSHHRRPKQKARNHNHNLNQHHKHYHNNHNSHNKKPQTRSLAHSLRTLRAIHVACKIIIPMFPFSGRILFGGGFLSKLVGYGLGASEVPSSKRSRPRWPDGWAVVTKLGLPSWAPAVVPFIAPFPLSASWVG